MDQKNLIYQELPEDGAFITAQLERNEVVYSVVLTKERNPLTREDAESHFKDELSKKYKITSGTEKIKGIRGSGTCKSTGSAHGGLEYTDTGESTLGEPLRQSSKNREGEIGSLAELPLIFVPLAPVDCPRRQ